MLDAGNIPALLVVFAILYSLWTMYYTMKLEKRHGKKGKDKDQPETEQKPAKRQNQIVGKSQFVLPQSQTTPPTMPQAATGTESEKGIEKPDIFVPSNVPEHPRIIPDDELDEVFGTPPEGEENKPLDINFPLYHEVQPDEADDPDEEETEDYEDLPMGGRPQANGDSFENMCEAYRTVVHNPIITDKKKEETGRVLLSLKHTDMFEALVSTSERADTVGSLIDCYLSAFHKRMAESSGENEAPAGHVPPDFNVRSFVPPTGNGRTN